MCQKSVYQLDQLDDPVDQEIAQYVSETLNKDFEEDDNDTVK